MASAHRHTPARAVAIPGFTKQRIALETVATAINRARDAADRDELFASHEGMALINVLFDLTEVDALYDLAIDVGYELGVNRDGSPLLHLAEAGK